MRRLLPAVPLLLATACATTHADLFDPTHVTVSDSSKIVSADLIPEADHYPRAVNHLALAEEIYQHKLSDLRSRRDTLRDRTRVLQAASFATFAASTIGIGAIGLSAQQNEAGAGNALRNGGYIALSGLAAGTLLQVVSYMQEDPAAIDAKVQRLQAAHTHMIDELQTISKAAPPPTGVQGSTLGVESQMATVIEAFMAEAAQISVKG